MANVTSVQRLRPEGLVSTPAFSHVAIAGDLASDEPPLVTSARVAGLGVPGALVEIGAVAAVVR